MTEMQIYGSFIRWKSVAFNFPRSAKSDSRDVQFSFMKTWECIVCVGLIPNIRICVLLTIPGDTFKKRSVLECKSPCEAVGLWDTWDTVDIEDTKDSGGIPGIPDASDN